MCTDIKKTTKTNMVTSHRARLEIYYFQIKKKSHGARRGIPLIDYVSGQC